jgi:hypothetical protein
MFLEHLTPLHIQEMKTNDLYVNGLLHHSPEKIIKDNKFLIAGVQSSIWGPNTDLYVLLICAKNNCWQRSKCCLIYLLLIQLCIAVSQRLLASHQILILTQYLSYNSLQNEVCLGLIYCTGWLLLLVLTSPRKCSRPFPFFALLHASIRFLFCISVFSCTALLIRTMSYCRRWNI